MNAKKTTASLLIIIIVMVLFATSVFAITVTYGLSVSNPFLGYPRGTAYTSTSQHVDRIGAKATMQNSDGTLTISPWAYHYSWDFVRSQEVKANTISGKNVILFGEHSVKHAGYHDWAGTSRYYF